MSWIEIRLIHAQPARFVLPGRLPASNRTPEMQALRGTDRGTGCIPVTLSPVERLFPKGLAGVHPDLLPHVGRVLDAAGVAKVDAHVAEDPQAAARLTDSTVLWMACDLGLVRCVVTITIAPPGLMRINPAILEVTPWTEVRGITLSAKTEGQHDPVTTLTLGLKTPALNLSAQTHRRVPHEQLRALATTIIGHLT
jgi:hypothetical protein